MEKQISMTSADLFYTIILTTKNLDLHRYNGVLIRFTKIKNNVDILNREEILYEQEYKWGTYIQNSLRQISFQSVP